MSYENRSWMYRGIVNGVVTEEFKDGVDSFIQFALRNSSVMASASERSSRVGSRQRRHRTLSVHLHHLGGGALAVEGRLGELQRGGYLMDNNGMSPSSEDMAWALLQITLRVAWAFYQKCILTYQWERREKTDREMFAHMSAMHRSWRSKQKKRHFNGKSLDDAIASVPAGASDWHAMCEMWTTADERSHMHGHTPHRLEVFKMDRCKDLPDGSESWVDEESRRRYEAMTQMIAPSSDIDAESHTPATPEDAFISVMGKDRLAVFVVRVVERRWAHGIDLQERLPVQSEKG
ncbi:hypothetical protein Taro_049765 [Colocasia esculenta]|uniref:Uncharacterized protein n=1 Tax=Colocasia esculenta TaxID=4460 RepID=A0A843XBN0_COLES|nr:hypothetical protein [Colocasia esculenta]